MSNTEQGTSSEEAGLDRHFSIRHSLFGIRYSFQYFSSRFPILQVFHLFRCDQTFRPL